MNVHFIYAVKGKMTEPPKDSVYSGIISVRSMRLELLIGETNGFKTIVGDIRNAHLEAYKKEKVYFAGKSLDHLKGIS